MAMTAHDPLHAAVAGAIPAGALPGGSHQHPASVLADAAELLRGIAFYGILGLGFGTPLIALGYGLFFR